MLVIVVIAAALRLASYDFSLPYVDHPDEPNYYLEALKWRGYYDPGGDIVGYPPGILVINSAVQTLMGDDGSLMPEVVRIVRLLSLTINLLTLVMIAFIARRLAGPIAGLIAALSWAIAPLVVEGGVFATADPYTYFFTAMAVWFALIALQDADRPLFAVWSVIAGLLAVMFKYPALPAILPGFVVSAYWLLTSPRKRWPMLLWQVLLVAAAGFFLLAVYGAEQMDIREADTIATSGWRNVLTPDYVMNNIYHAFVPIGGALPILLIVIGIILIIYRDRLKPRTVAVLVCLAALIGIPWVAASFSVVSIPGRIKDVLPATAIACALLGVGIVEVSKLFGSRRYIASAVMVGVVAVGIWGPHLVADVDHIRNSQFPDRRVDIRQWADQNLPAGTVLVGQENHKTFNPQWSGLVNNRQWFDWLVIDDLLANSPQTWREDVGVSYLALEILDHNRLAKTEAGQAFLDELLLLREFTNPPMMRGPEILFYRMWQPQHTLDIAFGDTINLIGYDISSENPVPGDEIQLTFYWQATSAPQRDYSLFLHLLPQSDEAAAPIAQYDGAPVRSERPTYTWADADEVLISQPITLTLPVDIQPGEYRLLMGLYDWETLVRLPVTPADGLSDAYDLMQFDIAP